MLYVLFVCFAETWRCCFFPLCSIFRGYDFMFLSTCTLRELFLFNKKLCSCLEPLLLHICVSASYCTRRFFSCENVTYSLFLSVNFVLFDFFLFFFLFCLIPFFFYRKWTKNSRNTKKSSACGRRRPRLHKTEYVGYCSSYLISV